MCVGACLRVWLALIPIVLSCIWRSLKNNDDKTRTNILSSHREIKQLEQQLKIYFVSNSKTKEKQPVFSKLARQFAEVQQLKIELDKHPKLVQIEKESEKKKRNMEMTQSAINNDEFDEQQQQQQQQLVRPKVQITTAQL